MPTDLNARLLARRARPRADLVDRVGAQRRPAADPAAALRLAPRARSTRSSSSRASRSSRCARVAVTPESATSVVLTKVLLPEAEHVPLGEEADAKLLIGDAALKSAFEDPTPHHDLGRLWLERTGLPMVFAVWAAPSLSRPGWPRSRTRSSTSVLTRPRRARAARLRVERALRLPGRLPRALLREAALPLRPARARRAAHVPRAGPRRRRARRGAGAPLRGPRRSRRLTFRPPWGRCRSG